MGESNPGDAELSGSLSVCYRFHVADFTDFLYAAARPRVCL
jgi:hypothetical protein